MENFGLIENLKAYNRSIICGYKNYLIAGGTDGIINFWDLSNLSISQEGTFECIHNLKAHTQHIRSLCIWSGPSQDYLISGSNDETIKIWDLSNLSNTQGGTVKCIKTLTGHTDYISNLCIWSGPTQDYLISGSWDTTIKIWDLSIVQEGTFECLETLRENIGSIFELCIYQDYLISASYEDNHENIRIWDLKTFECIKNITGKNINFVYSLCIYKDYLISANYDETIKIWNLSNAQEGTFECIKTLEHNNNSIFRVVIYQDYLISASSDKNIKIWDLTNFECIKTLTGHDASISIFCIYNDYLISRSNDEIIKIWDLINFECIKTLTGHHTSISIFCVYQDYFITSSYQTIKIWGDLDLYHFKKEDSKLQSVYSDISKDTELRLTETCLRCFLLEESRLNLLTN